MIVAGLARLTDLEGEPVTQVQGGCFAERGLSLCGLDAMDQADINVQCRAAWVESELEREAALQVPSAGLGCGQPCEQPAVSELAAEPDDPGLAVGPIIPGAFVGEPVDP